MKKLISLVLFTICSINGWANVAAPSQDGQTLTEPQGIKNIDILKEDLNIDFTLLGDESVPLKDRFIKVEAIYEVNNPVDLEKLELVFVIVSGAQNFQFFLDGKEIPTEPLENQKFADRQSWKKPDQTPFEDRELMYNPNNGNLKSAKFTFNLPKGQHQLKARYKAEPTVYKNIGVMKGWQFAYSLAPARDWKSFGGLNLIVKIPKDWKFFTNLKLEPNGEVLTGNFKEIPADFIAVTTQSTIPANYKFWTDLTFFTFLGCLLGLPVLIIWLAFWRGFSWKNSWVYGIFAGLGWGILLGISWYLSQTIPNSLIPESQYASYGYGDLFGIFLIAILVPMALVIGILLWIISVLLAKKWRS